MAKPKNTANKQSTPIAKSYDDLAQSLKNNQIQSVYLLFGEEDYLIEQVIRALSRRLIAQGCQDADMYSANYSSTKADPDRLYELVNTPPFLSDKRLIVIQESGLFSGKSPETPEAEQSFVRLFENIPDSSCLVFVEEKVDKRKKVLYEAVTQNGMAVHFARRSADDLGKWIAGTLKRHEIRITVDAMGSLIDRTEGSMRVLDNEVKKLILACDGYASKEISLSDVDAICVPDIRGSVFQMTDAIGARDIGKALRVLDTLISLKEPIPRIRFMLARHVRQLICAKEMARQDDIISSLKVVPFVARNLLSQSRAFRMEELLALYESCSVSDFEVKTGKMDDRLSMELLLSAAAKGE